MMLDRAGLHVADWYAVVVAGGSEMAIAEALRRRGFTVRCPLRRQWRRASRRAKRTELVQRVIIPTYLFVRMPLIGARWSDLMRLRAVRAVVCDQGRPAPLRAADLDWLATQEGLGAVLPPDHHAEMEHGFACGVGDEAEILGGPFDGKVVSVAAIHQRRGKHVATVVVPLFGSDRSSEISVAHLRKRG